MPAVIESINAEYIDETFLTIVALISIFAITSVIWLIILFFKIHKEKKWDSIKQNHCYDSFDAYIDTKIDDHFVFCDYYENFNQLMKDLEEVSGKTVITKNRPLKF